MSTEKKKERDRGDMTTKFVIASRQVKNLARDLCVRKVLHDRCVCQFLESSDFLGFESEISILWGKLITFEIFKILFQLNGLFNFKKSSCRHVKGFCNNGRFEFGLPFWN